MRLPTYDKPRIICCASLAARHVVLPRGCLDEAIHLLESNGIHVELKDHRERGVEVQVRFLGTLRDDQRRAVEALNEHEFGVLAATTAFGKTVIAAALIAERRCSTLVLVHRKELLGQWVERLKQFLSLGEDDLGVIGGGKRKPSGRIDVAVIESLVRKGEVSEQQVVPCPERVSTSRTEF
jgi:superfamily II DNA or RNA helicase